MGAGENALNLVFSVLGIVGGQAVSVAMVGGGIKAAGEGTSGAGTATGRGLWSRIKGWFTKSEPAPAEPPPTPPNREPYRTPGKVAPD